VIWERKRVRSLLGLPPLAGEGAEEPVKADRNGIETTRNGEEPAVQAARVTSKQAVLVALITALGGLATGWLSHGSSATPVTQQRYIKVTGVNSDGQGDVRIVIEVNGQAYSYPSRAVWAEVGPQMPSEVFPLPTGASEFSVHFSAFLSDGNSSVEIANTEQVQKFNAFSFPADADVRLLKQDGGRTRTSNISNLRISYSIY
jgi:hypothetical protein